MRAVTIRHVHWGPVLRFLLAALVGLAVVSLAAGSVPPVLDGPGDFDELKKPGRDVPRATVEASERPAPVHQDQPQSVEPREYGYPPRDVKPSGNEIWVDPRLMAMVCGIA